MLRNIVCAIENAIRKKKTMSIGPFKKGWQSKYNSALNKRNNLDSTSSLAPIWTWANHT